MQEIYRPPNNFVSADPLLYVVRPSSDQSTRWENVVIRCCDGKNTPIAIPRARKRAGVSEEDQLFWQAEHFKHAKQNGAVLLWIPDQIRVFPEYLAALETCADSYAAKSYNLFVGVQQDDIRLLVQTSLQQRRGLAIPVHDDLEEMCQQAISVFRTLEREPQRL